MSVGVAELFPDHPAQRRFQRLLSAPDVLSQRLVDQSLIVTSASPIHLLAKPVQNIIIQPDRDSGLALRNRDDWSAFASAEIVFTLHGFPHIAASRAGSLALHRRRALWLARKLRRQIADFAQVEFTRAQVRQRIHTEELVRPWDP